MNSMERLEIDGGNFVEIDHREDSWHEVWLMYEQNLELVALVMNETVYDKVVFGDGEITETPREQIRACIIPNHLASTAFKHYPGLALDKYEL